MRALIGELKRYAWGSTTALPRLLGVDPDGEPWAELWFGTHPGGPTHLADDPGATLASLSGPLPFLAKFLAAGAPLSLQVHPDDDQAASGFDREERLGVPADAPHRTYRDASSKPEVMIACTPFRALCGFRPLDEVLETLPLIGGAELAQRVERLGYSGAVRWLLAERPDLRLDHPVFAALDVAYPGDPGAAVAVLLNEVELEPGEAVFLPAGQLHMYLDGLGVEVMGASDNVVRGGLTVKHVDLDELARIVDDAPRRPPILRPDGNGWFDLPTPAFAVQEHRRTATWTAHGPELVLFAEQAGDHAPGSAVYVADGETVAVPTGLAYRVTRSRGA